MTAPGVRPALQALLARFDDEAWVALANRGLLRRAQKDLEKTAATVAEESADRLVVAFGEQRIRFDARGPATAQCSCPASGVCHHVLAASLALQRMLGEPAGAPAPEPAAAPDATTAVAPEPPAAPADALAPLRDALLKMSAAELQRHAGKSGYRWAWQFVLDLDGGDGLSLAGEQHVVIGFARPRLTLRYLGGGVEALIADAELRQIEKYRVAAVLAFQRAHGVEPAQPEPARAAAGGAALDFGHEHRLAATGSASMEASRARLRASARQLLAEAVELGLSHLSAGMQERFATLAVWAQGAEYHRLALMLRRLADHVEMLLERAGGADEHRLLDEMALALALVAALDDAAARGQAPAHLVGQARTRYEASSTLELWGLGASAWRSASGYQGLTMLFWAPADEAFYTCTDARPQSLRGFDPRARYRAAGPWSGLGAPSQATGRRLELTGAQINAGGRLSAAESCSVRLLPADPPGEWARRIQAWTSWTVLAQARAAAGRSLLAEARPQQDWVFLRPAAFGRADFDEARQTMVWPLLDAVGEVLVAELAYDALTAPAMERIEVYPEGPNERAQVLVARVRAGTGPLVAEPLSLLAGAASPASARAVDALHFDEAHEPRLASRLKAFAARVLKQGREPTSFSAVVDSRRTVVLRELRDELRRAAERGLAAEVNGIRPTGAARLDALLQRAATQGLDVAAIVATTPTRAGERLLRLAFVTMQCERGLGLEAVAD